MSFTYAWQVRGGGGLYFLTGEFCFDGCCAGQAQQSGLLGYPLVLRLTALTLTCQAGGLDCGPLVSVAITDCPARINKMRMGS